MRLSLFLFLTYVLTFPAIAQSPKRIVSIGGANTEILYALGAEDKIVGTDTTSKYPDAANNTPKVGYMRALSAEGILSLKPDLILLTDEAGPPPVLAQIKQVGVKVLKVKAARSLEDIRSNIATIGAVLQADQQATDLQEKIAADLDLLKSAIDRSQIRPRVMFVLQHGGGAPKVAGVKTAADGIIRISGADNVVTSYEGYKPLTPEAAIKLRPDFILVTDLGLESAGGIEAFANIPGINLTRAAKEKRIISMNSLLLLGFGPRTAEAALQLRQHYTDAKS